MAYLFSKIIIYNVKPASIINIDISEEIVTVFAESVEEKIGSQI